MYMCVCLHLYVFVFVAVNHIILYAQETTQWQATHIKSLYTDQTILCNENCIMLAMAYMSDKIIYYAAENCLRLHCRAEACKDVHINICVYIKKWRSKEDAWKKNKK